MAIKGKASLLVIVPLIIGLLTLWQRPSFTTAAKNTMVNATLLFKATVYQGPDKGLSLRGPLTLQVREPSGVTTGMLKPTKGSAIPVTGWFKSAAVNLVFNVSGNHIFGVGSDVWDKASRQWIIGGPLVGPQGGDFGDWAVVSCNSANPLPECRAIVTQQSSLANGSFCFFDGEDALSCGVKTS